MKMMPEHPEDDVIDNDLILVRGNKNASSLGPIFWDGSYGNRHDRNEVNLTPSELQPPARRLNEYTGGSQLAQDALGLGRITILSLPIGYLVDMT
jgi:hypothetical protein